MSEPSSSVLEGEMSPQARYAVVARLSVITRALTACAAISSSTLSLAACPGPPTGSISHRPNNVYDESLLQGGPSAAARLAQESLQKSYPIGSDKALLVSYLDGIGSNCIADGDTRTVCEMKSYFEMKYAYWLINAVVATGDVLERVEYIFTTTVESPAGKVKSIDVVKIENRLQ